MSTAGTFTVPKNGIYSMSYSGLGMDGSTRVFLRLNGADLVSAFAISKYGTYSMDLVMELKVGDKVTTFLKEGSVGDASCYYNTHFSGTLLEETLAF